MDFGFFLLLARRVERNRNEQVFYNDKENEGHEQRSETTLRGLFRRCFKILNFTFPLIGHSHTYDYEL